MTMRITGMVSGLDTESIIQELTKAYSKKTEKYEKAQTKLSWKQDAWKSLNSKIYSLYTNMSNLRFDGAYSTKKASVSDATKATASANGKAVVGSQKLNVLATAQQAYMTSAKLQRKDGLEVNSRTALSDLGYTGANTNIYITNKVDQWDEQEKKMVRVSQTTAISITKDTEIGDVIDSLQKAGVNASFDEKNGRIFVNVKNSGADEDFKIFTQTKTENGSVSKDSDSLAALTALGLNTDPTYKAGARITKEDGNLAAATNTLAELGYTGGASSFTVNGTPIAINDNTTLADIVTKLNDAGVKARFDEYENRIIMETDDKGNAPNAVFGGAAADVISKLGLNNLTESDKAIKIDGTDAQIRLNGALYTSSSNNFSINGIDIKAAGVTGDGDENAVTLTVENDTQAIYDKVKDFLTEYNTLINEMTKLYNAETSKGYEPLTDEEKDSMSDTEIQKWEAKIKDSLLRRDTTLDSVMSVMTNAMAKTYDVNGKSFSWSSFGIHTLGFLNAVKNEHNAYHIDGDEDDSVVSGNEDKLMAAIKDDPDSVVEFMKQLTSGLYSAIDKKMKSTTLSSAYNVYNDKEMNSQYSEYAKTIKKWEDKATSQEDYYYNQFAKMEKALSQLQSSTQNITGLFN